MPSTWPITKPYPARRSGSVGCTSLATEPSCFVGPSDFGAGSRSNSLELEALLRRRRVAPERVERAHAEGVAAGGQVLVGLRRLAVGEARLGALLLELALEARGAADRLEAEARGPLARPDGGRGDQRVRQRRVTQHYVAGLVPPDAQRWGGRRAGPPVEAPPPVGLVEVPVGRVAGRLDRGKRPPAVVDRRA